MAIDTFGSVSGELVQKFVQKIYILKQQEIISEIEKLELEDE